MSAAARAFALFKRKLSFEILPMLHSMRKMLQFPSKIVRRESAVQQCGKREVREIVSKAGLNAIFPFDSNRFR